MIIPSPNKYAGRDGHEVSGVVWHYTAAGSGKATARYFSKRVVEWTDKETGEKKTAKVGASAHDIICRDGLVISCVPYQDRAWHAGPASRWKGRELARGENVNNWTIGIELANWGPLERRGGKFYNYLGGEISDDIVMMSADGTFWEKYPEAQLSAAVAVLNKIRSTYPAIKPEDNCGHSDIQDNKRDPGPAFPLAQILRQSYQNTAMAIERADEESDDDGEAHWREPEDRSSHYDQDLEMCVSEEIDS